MKMPAHAASGPVPDFARAVRAGLNRPQKELPSIYLYDAIGTALFEAITLLPEYGLTRADERLLERHSGAILERLPSPLVIAELGSGSARKTRWLLEARAGHGPGTYYPIDISGAALDRCRYELSGVQSIGVVGLERSYLDGLEEVAARRQPGERLLVLFLGSTIGNFERAAAERFLWEIRGMLEPGDALLLGTDLLKAVPDLLLAYDDPAGVTAAFNLNLLGRINRELGGDFALRHFRHEARWNQALRRIEMHLVSSRRQKASIAAADCTVTLEPGESIWTEACHKFDAAELPGMARRCGFRQDTQWIDPEWPFAETLWIASPR